MLLLCLLAAGALRGQENPMPQNPDSLHRVLEQHTQEDMNRAKTPIEEIWRIGLLIAVFCACIAFAMIFRLRWSRNGKSRELVEHQRVVNARREEIDQRFEKFAWPKTVAGRPDPYTDTRPTNNVEDPPDAKDKDTLLVVEDNADLRNFMVECLSAEFHVLAAAHGEEGVSVAINAVPNLVLSDLMMPRLDGMGLTRVLKTDERTSHIPIIILTAKDSSSSRIEGLNTGADDYLTKPFSYDELRTRIYNLIRQRRQLAQRYRDRVFLPPSTEAQSMDDKFLQKSLAIIERHLEDSTFSVEKMADEIGLSRTQLLRKIKALTGLATSDLIRDIRLQKAADLIRHKADTVTQIGYIVGFSDQSYFAKCFKKKYGVNPSEYRG
jgi:DNA-binding response OmpR family regulator